MRFPTALLASILVLALASGGRAQDSKPLSFDMGKLSVTCTVPAGWTVQEGTPPSLFDQAGKKATAVFVGTEMQGTPEETFKVMHKAALDQGAERQKTGELLKNEEKVIDGFNGVYTVEAAKEGQAARRVQWIGYGHGGFYTVVLAAPVAAFEEYLPTFDAFLASLSLKPKK